MINRTNLQSGRLLPICEEDATQFSSDVYNKRYTSAKNASRFKQSGRSMIEMLGVLAIIGVLTVGSITGYSHAMRRHLLNKQREQISYILSTIETQYGALSASMSDFQSGNNTPVFINLGWIPQEMIKKNSSTYIYDVFKNRGSINFWRASSNYLGLFFYIQSPNAFEQCINLYQTAQPFHSSLWLTEIYQGTGYIGQLYGDRYCSGNNCLRNLTPAQISKLCQVCKDKNECRFYYFWK